MQNVKVLFAKLTMKKKSIINVLMPTLDFLVNNIFFVTSSIKKNVDNIILVPPIIFQLTGTAILISIKLMHSV